MRTTLDTRFWFLTTGPRFQVSLPADFKTPGHLTTPVSNGVGARSLIFMPADADPGVEGLARLIDMGVDRDGRPVQFYERLDPPLTWWLRWPLVNGALGTHVREEDGLGSARTVIANVSLVQERLDEPPFVLLYPPLRTVVSSRPGYQEVGTFVSQREEWSVSLYRPGFLREGQMVVMPEWEVANRSLVRAGATAGIEVLVGGPDLAACRALAGEVAESLKEI